MWKVVQRPLKKNKNYFSQNYSTCNSLIINSIIIKPAIVFLRSCKWKAVIVVHIYTNTYIEVYSCCKLYIIIYVVIKVFCQAL